MKYVFAQSLKDAYSENGDQGVITLWTRTLIDASRSLITQHIDNQKGGESMKNKSINILKKNKDITSVLLIGTAVLLIPRVAMQFSDDIVWTFFDFVFAGILLFGIGLTFVLVIRKMKSIAYKAAFGIALAAIFLLIWINGAVGIIGDDNPANLLYGAVIAVGIISSAFAKLKAREMTRAMIATAITQALVPIIALFIWNPETTSWAPGVLEVFVLNSFFVVMFIISALLFRHAAQKRK